jgi:hypothetical protein
LSPLNLFVLLANSYDKSGKQCPLFEHDNVACPMLCVTNQNLCPTALAATCPTGMSFCGDGTCQTSCENIANACQCGDTTVNYFPCAAGQLVNITHFDPVNQVVQIQNTCAAGANINSTVIGAWGDFNSSSLWLSCPVINPYFTYTEPMWIAVWALMGAEAAILALWAIYKFFRESKYRGAMALNTQQQPAITSETSTTDEKHKPIRLNSQVDESDYKMDVAVSDEKQNGKAGKSADGSIASESIKESEKLKFRGFLNDHFGMFAFGSVVITTLLFFVFLGCIVGDYCK